MSECIFCKIRDKQIPSNIIFEDDNVMAFLDVNPKSEGHTLIVPKEHYENILLKEDDIDLFEYIKKVANILKEKYEFEDIKIIINNGEKAGQEVFHTHIHLVPFY